MAFQLPEDQMFGHTVGDYISFGPSNIGVQDTELAEVVDETLRTVGLDPERYRKRDPFTLSGGEQRLAALAGVLAMRPDVLVLDEPTAGLDRKGMDTVISILDAYRSDDRILLFSTHDLEVAHRLAEHVVVLMEGSVETAGAIGEAFRDSVWLGKIGQKRSI
jgi:energy-coupling factor transport system ATP-binding protein